VLALESLHFRNLLLPGSFSEKVSRGLLHEIISLLLVLRGIFEAIEYVRLRLILDLEQIMKLLVLRSVLAGLHQHGLLADVLHELFLLLELVVLLLLLVRLHHGCASHPEVLVVEERGDLILNDGMAEGLELPDLLLPPVYLLDNVLDNLGLIRNLLKAYAIRHF
jgi:hypothetical protein